MLSSRQRSSTLSSQPLYSTITTSLAVCASKLDMSVASHSTTNGRSAFLGLHLFAPAKVPSISELWPDSRGLEVMVAIGVLPPQPQKAPATVVSSATETSVFIAE